MAMSLDLHTFMRLAEQPSATRIWLLAAAFALSLAASPGLAQSASTDASGIAEASNVLWADVDADAKARARQELENAAVAGDAQAQLVLGQHLLNGWVLERDAKQGLALLEKSAAAGTAAAQAELGQAYLFGTHVAADHGRALQLLDAAAGQGDLGALRLLGEQLVGGWTLPRDTKRGTAFLEQAVGKGDAKAQVTLGKLLLHGVGIEEDRARALTLFEAAAEAGNAKGLVVFGEDIMWKMRDPARAEAMLVRAGEMGADEAWSILANGAMYGYLGGGRVSRAKFDGYAEKARAAGQDEIAVLDATRNMWGINMRASGPETIARLRSEADKGNAAAARFLIELLRNGNRMNLWPDPKGARDALETYGGLLSDTARAQYAMTLDAERARTPEAYATVAAAFEAQPELWSGWFSREMVKANPNVAFYILQKRFKDAGSYGGALNGYATRSTLRAVFQACLELDKPERCDDSVMRADVIADLLTK
ncbi:tetratricopeptide repeat protein [Alisedimentitalea sp. MJ-SS2]|uniref:tetratricopeptide repeat protein n=1 Tax=Aliisedimentitalea sp. MJ-SS2 TaxID=3049795 RepID=UPI002911C853|nr:tetratricopeptide repeat protein [Alisedimentitalea sp. MJ-SS2]MDU8925954.1 tetratricopeptide repeat protein [Alisedimentitalea sp. MJ-SS2]